MPTTRRKQAATAATRNQQTLSFNNKSARVTKPSIHDTSASGKKAQSKLSEPAEVETVEEVIPQEPEPESVPAPTTDPSEEQAAPQEISVLVQPSQPIPRRKKSARSSTSSTVNNARESAASKVSDSQLKKYWKAEEETRLAPRVHQSQVPLHEKILRHFDLSSQFGPCIGIARLARWKRADALGLEPPVEVLAVLLREEDKKTSQGCGKLAYIDELGGGRVGIVD